MQFSSTLIAIRFGARLLLPILAYGVSAESRAAEEPNFLDEIPVVLTASRILQSPLDAPAPVTVIDRETIQASGFTEIHDIFRLVPTGDETASSGECPR